jgi:hypothetical protein
VSDDTTPVITDPWGHTPEEYGEVFASLADDFAGHPGHLVPGELGKRVKESVVNHCLMYGQPGDELAELLILCNALAQGVLVWASLEGYIELTEKALAPVEPELVEAS